MSHIKIDSSTAHVVVEFGGAVIADTRNAKLLREGSSLVYYLPPEDVKLDALSKGSGSSVCPWKGRANYYDAPGRPGLAWYYPDPKPDVAAIKDHVAFYNSRIDQATVDGVPTPISPY